MQNYFKLVVVDAHFWKTTNYCRLSWPIQAISRILSSYTQTMSLCAISFLPYYWLGFILFSNCWYSLSCYSISFVRNLVGEKPFSGSEMEVAVNRRLGEHDTSTSCGFFAKDENLNCHSFGCNLHRSSCRAWLSGKKVFFTLGHRVDVSAGGPKLTIKDAIIMSRPPQTSCRDGISPRSNNPRRVVKTGSSERMTLVSAAGTEDCAFC